MEDFVSLHRQSQDIPIKNKAVTPPDSKIIEARQEQLTEQLENLVFHPNKK